MVKAVDPAGQPLPGLRVTVMTANRVSEKVESLPAQTTAADGTARFTELKTGLDQGYMVGVHKDGSDQRSAPFQLNVQHGSWR